MNAAGMLADGMKAVGANESSVSQEFVEVYGFASEEQFIYSNSVYFEQC